MKKDEAEFSEKIGAVEKQCELLDEILITFEKFDNLPDHDKKIIFSKMQHIQELGPPPQSVLDSMTVHMNELI